MAWDDLVEKRVAVLEPGRLVRGAWQRPGPLRRIVEREKIKTIVTLTAINRDDPKFVSQAQVVRQTGVRWIIVPMHGSRASLDQMAEAADLLADPRLQPVFFHCVAGHHRTSLVHAAYRMRHQGWSAERAWREVAALPWTRPQTDIDDHRLIAAFAEAPATAVSPGKEAYDASSPGSKVDRGNDRRTGHDGGSLRGLEAGHGQPRDRRARADLSVGADGRKSSEPGRS
ncbi:MAG TPA: hypothetical protein VGZ22_00835 [Isosphaeraceae bacterium]|nr:hypothetical protein [Isosphaeraceae bacterium]